MDESTVAAATADVMVYDDAKRGWIGPDGGEKPARSDVRILHNTHTNAFRIVGIRLEDRQWILNCNVYEKLNYNPAPTRPLFHRWRDERKKVYGLIFSSAEDADSFISVMKWALAMLASNSDYQNGPAFGNSNGIYHEPQQLHHVVHSEPLLRDNDQDSICSGGMPTVLSDNYRKSSHSMHSSASVGLTLANAQRRASQGSSGSSSNGSSGPTMVYAPSSAAVSCSPMRAAQAQDPPATVSSNVPPAPPLPPSGIGIAPLSSNAPPAPPPPPPLSAGGLGAAKAAPVSMADQIKNFQMRKTNAASNSVSAPKNDTSTGNRAPPGGFVSELEATLNKRKNLVENADARSTGEPASNGVVKRAWERPSGAGLLNGTSSGSTDSPKMHRNVNRAPSGSSLSSQEEPRQNSGSVAIAKGGDNSSVMTGVTLEMLEKWRIDLLNEVREEINRAKNEILDAIRNERR